MKKSFVIILFVLAFATVCFATCPDQNSHKEEVKEFLTESLQDSVGENSLKGLFSIFSNGIAFFASESLSIDYHNYILFSICKISYEDAHTYSIGILNNIIILGKDKIKESVLNGII